MVVDTKDVLGGVLVVEVPRTRWLRWWWWIPRWRFTVVVVEDPIVIGKTIICFCTCDAVFFAGTITVPSTGINHTRIALTY